MHIGDGEETTCGGKRNLASFEFRQKRRKKKEFDFSPFVDNSDSPFAKFNNGRSGGRAANGASDVEASAADAARWKRPLRPFVERGDPERQIEFGEEFRADAKVEEKSNPVQLRGRRLRSPCFQIMAEMGLPLGFVAPRENALYDEDTGNVALKVAKKKVSKDSKKKKAGKHLNFKKDKVSKQGISGNYLTLGMRLAENGLHFRSRGTPTRRGT